MQNFISLNSAMESVEIAQHSYTMTPVFLGTVEEINNYHDNYSRDLPNNTYYRYMASNTVGGGQLGNATWYVEGLKSSNSYEWQLARTYLSLANGGMRYRSKWNGAWGEWTSLI